MATETVPQTHRHRHRHRHSHRHTDLSDGGVATEKQRQRQTNTRMRPAGWQSRSQPRTPPAHPPPSLALPERAQTPAPPRIPPPSRLSASVHIASSDSRRRGKKRKETNRGLLQHPEKEKAQVRWNTHPVFVLEAAVAEAFDQLVERHFALRVAPV
eukprot:607159-Rhodomonas_salina.3